MVRGRKANLDLPLTPALIQQREFREKRANQIKSLQDDNTKLSIENAQLQSDNTKLQNQLGDLEAQVRWQKREMHAMGREIERLRMEADLWARELDGRMAVPRGPQVRENRDQWPEDGVEAIWRTERRCAEEYNDVGQSVPGFGSPLPPSIPVPIATTELPFAPTQAKAKTPGIATSASRSRCCRPVPAQSSIRSSAAVSDTCRPGSPDQLPQTAQSSYTDRVPSQLDFGPRKRMRGSTPSPPLRQPDPSHAYHYRSAVSTRIHDPTLIHIDTLDNPHHPDAILAGASTSHVSSFAPIPSSTSATASAPASSASPALKTPTPGSPLLPDTLRQPFHEDTCCMGLISCEPNYVGEEQFENQ